MGRIQEMRMERAKRAFQKEMFFSDRSRSFFVDHAGNAVGFRIERENGLILSYDAVSGYFQPFEILPEDKVVDVPPFEYRDGKIVATEIENKPSVEDMILVAEGQRKAAPFRDESKSGAFDREESFAQD